LGLWLTGYLLGQLVTDYFPGVPLLSAIKDLNGSTQGLVAKAKAYVKNLGIYAQKKQKESNCGLNDPVTLH